MTDIDIVEYLRDLHRRGEATGAEQEAADEIEQLREELAQMKEHVNAWTDVAEHRIADAWLDEVNRWEARALRAEADADRLAEALAFHGDHPGSGDRCPACDALDLHDREVEAR